MFVCGANKYNQLYVKDYQQYNLTEQVIYQMTESLIDISTLFSISLFAEHIVYIDQDGRAYAIGNNEDYRIYSELPNDILTTPTEIILKDFNKKAKFISAVCGFYYTLYLVMFEGKSDNFKLFYCSKDGQFFVNLNGPKPVALFGGFSTSAVIDSEGGIIIITYKILYEKNRTLDPISLPSGEKPVQLACCNEKVYALDCKGHLFVCDHSKEELKFEEVAELSRAKVVYITGLFYHCFAVCENGSIYGIGHNSSSMLGLDKKIREVDHFVEIEALHEYNIVAAFAGVDHSVFKTSDNHLLVCGSNKKAQLLDYDCMRSRCFPPDVAKDIFSRPFCIVGNGFSVVIHENQIPPNTPNTKLVLPEPDFEGLRNENSSLQSIVGNMVAEIDKYKQEIMDLMAQNRKLHKTIDQKNIEISDLQKKITSFAIKESEDKDRINKLEIELEVQQKLVQKASKNEEKVTPTSKPPTTSNCGIHPLEMFDQMQIGSLHRINRIGRGTKSEVFKVSNEQNFAQKFFFSDDEFDSDELTRFIQGYETLILQNCKNIVKAFSITKTVGSTHSISILLELCHCNLKKKIDSLSDIDIVGVVVDIAHGMKEIHDVGLVHKNFKLENILLDKKNKAKIGDFGLFSLTKDYKKILKNLKDSQENALFLAPELINGEDDVTEKVDVYAFGVVLFVILTKGEFPDISIDDVGDGKLAEIPSNITEFSSDLIKKCWSFNPLERPSFTEICSMLEGNERQLV